MRRRITAIVVALELASLLGACGTPAARPSVSRHWSESSARVLTADELRGFSPTLTLYDVVVRAQMLRGRYEDAVVYIDGRPHADKGALQSIPVTAVREVRLLSASEATARYGTLRPRGSVIDVSTMAVRR